MKSEKYIKNWLKETEKLLDEVEDDPEQTEKIIDELEIERDTLRYILK